MCGIVGFAGSGSGELLATMLGQLAHRGPDDSGVFVDAGIGLGMTRFAIFDLAGGRQPMMNEDSSLQSVFNGEIYNHRELRPGLEKRGHVFGREATPR